MTVDNRVNGSDQKARGATQWIRRRKMIGAVSTACIVGLAGCLGESNDSDVQDSDGDGVIDSEDYAPHDPDVQEKSDIGAGDGSGGQSDTSGNSDGQDSPTPEPTPTPTPEMSCRTEVDDTITVGSQESQAYEFVLDQGDEIRITAQTEEGKEPILTITTPSGSNIVDEKSEPLIRETFTTTESGSYLFRLENGALMGEQGVWSINIDICSRG